MLIRNILLIIVIWTTTACNPSTETEIGKYTVGVVSYGGKNSVKQYADFEKYLATQLNSIIEIEPVYNEIKALEQISGKKWDLVLAPPGLAAIAISRYNYQPIVPLEATDETRSVIVTQSNSTFKERGDLAGKTIALGQKGSATGYYLPLYNLYGLKFAQILYAATPEEVLQLIDENKVAVGALSVAEYNLYRRDFDPNRFKVIYVDEHPVPSGAILISDRVEFNQQDKIAIALSQTPSFIAASAGFLPNEPLPNYQYLIKVIKRVQEISPKSLQ
ncbi:MAG: phosphate/phosphite/phosphonate ABC transporter substrate-binding protein [Waterburya sp.]